MQSKQRWALDELLEELKPGETIEYVVFDKHTLSESRGPNGEDFIPEDLIGVRLSFEECKKYFYGWNIINDFYGEEEVVPFFAWTPKRLLFIGIYDGATWLESIPRNPCDVVPFTVGGG